MPKFQVSEYGYFTLLGRNEDVLPLAVTWSRVVIPLKFCGGIPPFARNGLWQTGFGQLTVLPICGGRESTPMLSYRTSYPMPKPPRIDVFPLVPGEYANPTRGMKSFVGA